MRKIWQDEKLRGRGYSKAEEIVRYARESVGLEDGTDAGREAVVWFAEEIGRLTEQLSDIEERLEQKCLEIPVLKISWRFQG